MAPEFAKEYFHDLTQFLTISRHLKDIYPAEDRVFAAFNYTPFDQVKVVILGQDPYHGEGQANGLAFSVNSGVPIPPSLRNIFKELRSDLNIETPMSGDLTSWAQNGVLLLNSILTVEANQAASHQKKGWETFTDAALSALAANRKDVVFLLWGSYAASKAKLIESIAEDRHDILIAPHPSPLSAHKGFFGCGHFFKANERLVKNGVGPIKWDLCDR